MTNDGKDKVVVVDDKEEGQPREFEVTIKLRNNRLKQRRLQLGFTSQESFAQHVGITISAYNGLECLRDSPINMKGQWKENATKLAEFYGCLIEELFPAAILAVHKKEVVLWTDLDDLAPLLTDHQERLLMAPDDLYDDKDLRKRLEHLLTTLNPREQEVLRLRFGLFDGDDHTLAEAGEMLGVSGNRIMQIETNALRKLRWKTRSKYIKEYVEYEDRKFHRGGKTAHG